MKRFVIYFSCLFLCIFQLLGQQGFRKVYGTDTIGGSYVDLLWDGTKLITSGQYLIPQPPNGAYNGLQYVELDTNGQILYTDLYFEPNVALTSENQNNMTLLSNGLVLVTTQTLYDTFGIVAMYDHGVRIKTLKIHFPNKLAPIWALHATEYEDAIFITGMFANLDFNLESYIIKTDMMLNILWEKTFKAPNLEYLGVGGLLSVHKNKMLFPLRVAYSPPNPQNGWVYGKFLTLDSTGNQLSEWSSQQNYENGAQAGQTISLGDSAYLYGTQQLIQTPGQLDPFTTIPKIVCRDTAFNLLWQRELSTFKSTTNRIDKIAATPDGNFVALGNYGWYSRMAIHKFAPNGDSIWTFAEVGPTYWLYMSGLAVLPSGSIFAAGAINELGRDKPILFKITPDGCLDTLSCGPWTSVETDDAVQKVSVFPNPTSNEITVRNPIGNQVLLFDLAGKLVLEQEVQSKESITVAITSLPPGTYFLKMQNAKLTLTYKVIIVR